MSLDRPASPASVLKRAPAIARDEMRDFLVALEEPVNDAPQSLRARRFGGIESAWEN
jgi:hypothetical protein